MKKKYIVTAKSHAGHRMVSCFDDVFDSLMLVPSSEDKFVLFNTKKHALDSMEYYQKFQRTLKDWRVEEFVKK